MDFTSTRHVDPDTFSATFGLSAEDIEAAFAGDDQTTHDLYFRFWRHLEAHPVSERLSILSEVVARAERAKSLNLSATVEDKTGA